MTNPQYSAGAPKLSDALAKSQKDFLQNFNLIFSSFGANHQFTNSAGDGNHNLVQLLQGNGRQTNTGEYGIYSKDVPDQTTQIFIRPQKGGPEVQYTNYQIYPIGDTHFFSTLPGGFIIYFGQLPKMKTGDTFTLNPTPTNIIGCGFTPISSSTTDYGPWVQFKQSDDKSGFVDTLVFNAAQKTPGNAILPQYYIIIGNFL